MEINDENPFKVTRRDTLFKLLKNLLDNKIKVLENKNNEKINDLNYSKKTVETLTKNCEYYNHTISLYIKSRKNNLENDLSKSLSKETIHKRGMSRDITDNKLKNKNKIFQEEKERRSLTPIIKLINKKKSINNSKVLNNKSQIKKKTLKTNRSKTPIKLKEKSDLKIKSYHSKEININDNNKKLLSINSKDNSFMNSFEINDKRRKTFSGVLDNFLNNDDELLTSIDTDFFYRNSIINKFSKFNFLNLFEKEGLNIFLQFMKLKDLFNCVLINKKIGRFFLNEIIIRCNSKLILFEKEFQKEKKNIIDVDLNKIEERLKEKFELSFKSKKALELLNDKLYLEFFINYKRKKPNENIIQIYKLFTQLLNKTGFDIEVSNLILLFNNSEKFWFNFSKFIILKANGKLGDYILKEISKLDFSKQNLEKIKELVKSMIYLLNPTNFTKDNPTTALIVFVLKDIIEFLGFLNPNIENLQKLKIYIEKYKKFKEKNKELKLIFQTK